MNVGRTRTGIGLVDLTASFTDGRGQVGRSQFKALGFLYLLGRAGALTNEFPLMLGQHSHEAYREGVGIGDVTGHKVHFGLRKEKINETLRLSRSSLAMSSRAPCCLAWAMAAAN